MDSIPSLRQAAISEESIEVHEVACSSEGAGELKRLLHSQRSTPNLAQSMAVPKPPVKAPQRSSGPSPRKGELRVGVPSLNMASLSAASDMEGLAALKNPQHKRSVSMMSSISKATTTNTSKGPITPLGRGVSKGAVMIYECSTGRKFTKLNPKAFVAQLTHVNLAGRGLKIMEGFEYVPLLQVLYLYDNDIQRIQNLQSCRSLKALYLQNNKIAKVDQACAAQLSNLERLYLDNNCLVNIDGIEGLKKLKYLSIARQNGPQGSHLLIPYSLITALQGTLVYLNISGNGVTSLRPFCALKLLENFECRDSHVPTIDDACDFVAACTKLAEINLSGNPCAKKHRYRERLIVANRNLEKIDEKEVSTTHRSFLVKLEAKVRPVVHSYPTPPPAPQVKLSVSSSTEGEKGNGKPEEAPPIVFTTEDVEFTLETRSDIEATTDTAGILSQDTESIEGAANTKLVDGDGEGTENSPSKKELASTMEGEVGDKDIKKGIIREGGDTLTKRDLSTGKTDIPAPSPSKVLCPAPTGARKAEVEQDELAANHVKQHAFHPGRVIRKSTKQKQPKKVGDGKPGLFFSVPPA